MNKRDRKMVCYGVVIGVSVPILAIAQVLGLKVKKKQIKSLVTTLLTEADKIIDELEEEEEA